MNSDIKNAFKIEKLRDSLSKENKFDDLKKTYSNSYPEITGDNTPSLWDKLNIEQYNTVNKNNPMVKDRLRIVSKKIQGTNIKVLNIGFGSGNLEEFNQINIKKNKIQWIGVDFSSKSVSLASKKYNMCKFFVSATESIPFPSDYFDYVIALEVLEHIKPANVFKTYLEIKRVINKHGKLICSVPLNENLEEMLSYGINPNQHVRVYTPDLISSEIKIAGFDIVNKVILFAFNKEYFLKKFLLKLFPFLKKPNNIILIAENR